MSWGAVLSGVAGLVSAGGALKSGDANARAARMNARIAEDNATISENQTVEEERRFRVQSRKIIGDMRASYGASGVTSEGSAMEVLSESAATAELDALTVRFQGQLRTIGFRNEARMQRSAGRSASTAGTIGAAAQLVNAAADVGSKIGGR